MKDKGRTRRELKHLSPSFLGTEEERRARELSQSKSEWRQDTSHVLHESLRRIPNHSRYSSYLTNIAVLLPLLGFIFHLILNLEYIFFFSGKRQVVKAEKRNPGKVSKGAGAWEDKSSTEMGHFCSAPCFNHFHAFLFIFLSPIS